MSKAEMLCLDAASGSDQLKVIDSTKPSWTRIGFFNRIMIVSILHQGKNGWLLNGLVKAQIWMPLKCCGEIWKQAALARKGSILQLDEFYMREGSNISVGWPVDNHEKHLQDDILAYGGNTAYYTYVSTE